MMNFRTIKTALVTTLGNAALNRFRAVGFQGQNDSSDAIKNNDRMVQVHYINGNFDKASNGMYGQKNHDCSFQIDMLASAPALGNIAILESETATAQQKAAAIIGIKESTENADQKIDELMELVYQILMDARKVELGLGKGIISSRWIAEITKFDPVEHGDLVVKTAKMIYTCRCVEEVNGDIGNEPDPVIFDTGLMINDKIISGVKVENDN